MNENKNGSDYKYSNEDGLRNLREKQTRETEKYENYVVVEEIWANMIKYEGERAYRNMRKKAEDKKAFRSGMPS